MCATLMNGPLENVIMTQPLDEHIPYFTNEEPALRFYRRLRWNDDVMVISDVLKTVLVLSEAHNYTHHLEMDTTFEYTKQRMTGLLCGFLGQDVHAPITYTGDRQLSCSFLESNRWDQHRYLLGCVLLQSIQRAPYKVNESSQM